VDSIVKADFTFLCVLAAMVTYLAGIVYASRARYHIIYTRSSLLFSNRLNIQSVNDGTLDPVVLQNAGDLVCRIFVDQNADKIQSCINASS
jgi:hypothetical protein